MPRNHTPDSDRATIAKLRAKVAQLEAKLADARDAPPAEIDLSEITIDDFARKWSPTPEEEARIRAELIERLTVFGRNTGTLSEEKVRALPREVRESICEDWTDIKEPGFPKF